MSRSPAKARPLRQLMGILIPAVLGAGAGFLIARTGLSHPAIKQTMDALSAWDLLVLPLLILLVIAVHEAGHLAGGLLRGMRFLIFVVGPFQWTQTVAGVRFNWVFNLGTLGGLAACMPDPQRPLARQMLPMILGGPLASALLALLCLGLWPLFDGRPAAYLMIAGALSTLIFVATAVPMRAGGFMSDGKQFLEMRRGGAAVRARHRLTLLMAQSMGGTRPAQWDPALIEESLADEQDEPLRRLAALLYAFLHALDRGEAPRAATLAEQLAERIDDYPDGFRQSIAVELALFHALVEQDLGQARHWLGRSRGGVVDGARRALATAAVAALAGDAATREAQLAVARRQLRRTLDPGVGTMTAEQIEQLCASKAAV